MLRIWYSPYIIPILKGVYFFHFVHQHKSPIYYIHQIRCIQFFTLGIFINIKCGWNCSCGFSVSPPFIALSNTFNVDLQAWPKIPIWQKNGKWYKHYKHSCTYYSNCRVVIWVQNTVNTTWGYEVAVPTCSWYFWHSGCHGTPWLMAPIDQITVHCSTILYQLVDYVVDMTRYSS